MASSGKLVFFFFFLAVFSSIQARESKFFSKFTRYSITENTGRKESTISSVPIQAPTSASASAPAPAIEFLPDVPVPAPAIEDLPDVPVLAPAQAPVIGESENGYGLFSEDSTSTTTTTTAANENELLNEELDGVHFNKKYENSYYNNNNNNGYKVDGARYETGKSEQQWLH
ncbi:hypothetical protein OIU74_015538 [Salix koriyanagi]|uniref:Uncharacterized protein n=1 Tax=Salix koriyanagi TaxID=2511006 RepID=A0A9Q0PMB6_9ROSI|nr:hypothetical protein OIU74_015538 [Salix koriyanagi]